MSDWTEGVLFVAAMLMFGGFLGWVVAHSEVAAECRKLGTFYVGNTVFVCEVKK